MYLNLYQPRLQHGAGIAAFFVGHRGHRFASSALMAPMTAAFTADIEHFIAARGVDLVRFGKGQRKDDVTAGYLRRAEVDDRGLVQPRCCMRGWRKNGSGCSGPASAATRSPGPPTRGSSQGRGW